MSVPYANKSRICSSTTQCKARNLRNIWKASQAVDYSEENPAAVQTFAYAGTDPTSDAIIDSVEFDIPENMIGDVDFITAVRAHLIEQTAAPAATLMPSAYLAAPFRIIIHKVFVSTTGAITVDTTFDPLSILVPRAAYNPLLTDLAAPLYPWHSLNTVMTNDTVSADTTTITLVAGRYVADLHLEMDDQYWAESALPGGWEVYGFTMPTGFAAYFPLAPGTAPPYVTPVPPLLQVRSNFTFDSCTRTTSFSPLDTANKMYLCTNRACTESDANAAVSLSTCIAQPCV
jgi:hypothetical protein